MDLVTCNYLEARTRLLTCLKARLPVALWGPPGCGKTSLARNVAEEFNLEFIDVRLSQHDPVNLQGFIHKDPEKGTFDFLPWDRFPLEGDTPPAGKRGWLIMFDEINHAPRQTLAAAYALFLERTVGSRALHENVWLVAGGNLMGQGLAGAMPMPLVNRMAHIAMAPALVPDLEGILGKELYAFLNEYPRYLYEAPVSANTPYPTLRSMEMLHKYEQALGGPATIQEAAGLVGLAAATALTQWRSTAQARTYVWDLINNSRDPIPMEDSQAVIELLQNTPTELSAIIPRFQGEWAAIASATVATSPVRS